MGYEFTRYQNFTDTSQPAHASHLAVLCAIWNQPKDRYLWKTTESGSNAETTQLKVEIATFEWRRECWCFFFRNFKFWDKGVGNGNVANLKIPNWFYSWIRKWIHLFCWDPWWDLCIFIGRKTHSIILRSDPQDPRFWNWGGGVPDVGEPQSGFCDRRESGRLLWFWNPKKKWKKVKVFKFALQPLRMKEMWVLIVGRGLRSDFFQEWRSYMTSTVLYSANMYRYMHGLNLDKYSEYILSTWVWNFQQRNEYGHKYTYTLFFSNMEPESTPVGKGETSRLISPLFRFHISFCGVCKMGPYQL